MININLLSPSQKKELKLKRIYIAIKELVILVLLFTLIIAILLLSSKYILDNRLAKLITKNAITIEANREVISKINSLNIKTDTVDKIQDNFKKWSDFLAVITRETPSNISYELINIRYENAALELSGTARSRGDLIKLRDNLDELDIIENVNLPLKDLLLREGNNFTITASIILDKLN